MGDSMLGRLFSRGRKESDEAARRPSTAPPAYVRCQVCGSMAPLLDTVDFNKTCEVANARRLPPSGMPIRYHLCLNCGFCFAPEIQAWSREQFAASIYNDDYASVDPEYVRDRPVANASLVDDLFGGSRGRLRHLDYGGGSGLLSATLQAKGWDSATYDPYVDLATNMADLGTYDLLTAFEVFEHVPDVQVLLDNLDRLCRPDGLILFTTLLSDRQLALGRKMTWWYAAPRNGHISLFSTASLTRWMSGKQLMVASLSAGTHVACRKVPPWAAHLFPAT
jgi:SAM-dependent methyltransferase